MDLKQFIEELCKFPQMTTIERKALILKHLWNTSFLCDDKDGDIVEIGCSYGQTSIIIKNFIELFCPDKEFWVFDSFEGILGTSEKDSNAHGYCGDGDFASSLDSFIKRFNEFDTDLPDEILKVDIRNMKEDDLPEKISFCYIDLDIYEPTKHILPLVWNRLKEGGVIVIDDYYYEEVFNGVKPAVDEFIEENSIDISQYKKGDKMENFLLEYFNNNERSGYAIAISKRTSIDTKNLEKLWFREVCRNFK
tara:strand:+ start:2082 stop:2831 length:750 start_codon:yes stop_codon:yes gene_type:complete